MRRKIENHIKERIIPFLKTHGGKIEVVDVDNDVAYLRLDVEYHNKGQSEETLQYSVKKALCETFPELKDVIYVEKKGP